MQKRLIAVAVVMTAMFSVLYMRLYVIVNDKRYSAAGAAQSSTTLEIGCENANIYDRQMRKLVNNDVEYLAAIAPSPETVEEILPHLKDKNEFYEQLVYGSPFVCEIDTKDIKSNDINVFKEHKRYSSDQSAVHVIGYVCDGTGVTGIESAYDDFLRSHTHTNRINYAINGLGRVLDGIKKEITIEEPMTAGVVLTIDKYIQSICELAGRTIEKGAIVVMDIQSGDILAMASFPDYDPNNIGAALSDKNSPLINRCLYSYSVGSIFKLVTALSAFEQGIDEDFSYKCKGWEEVEGQIFMCHDHSGHGNQDMTQAMSNSCNTYFIKLAQRLKITGMRDTAQKLGFGTAISLAAGINADGGYLQSEEELALPAERANFSFGQGKLSASPLQICRFTSAIANEGKLFLPRLVVGITEDGKEIKEQKGGLYTQVFDRDTAFRLQDLMTAAVNGNPHSNARPSNTRAAGKTSTAQTGIFDENGEELCHGWITGYFPISQPKYAVTVLCEDGGYGNDCAAPVFKEIAERITDIYEKSSN